jgi:RimJ/RimL family protein N-acetyltransferase
MHVELRAMQDEDKAEIFKFQSDPASCRMAVVNARDQAGFDAFWAKVMGDATIASRSILVDGVIVGSMSVFTMEGERMLGYWIDRAWWGRGVASRAVKAFLEDVKERPIVAHVADTNAGSIKVLERNGFVLQSTEESPASERYPACLLRKYRLG